MIIISIINKCPLCALIGRSVLNRKVISFPSSASFQHCSNPPNLMRCTLYYYYYFQVKESLPTPSPRIFNVYNKSHVLKKKNVDKYICIHIHYIIFDTHSNPIKPAVVLGLQQCVSKQDTNACRPTTPTSQKDDPLQQKKQKRTKPNVYNNIYIQYYCAYRDDSWTQPRNQGYPVEKKKRTRKYVQVYRYASVYICICTAGQQQSTSHEVKKNIRIYILFVHVTM